MMSAYINMSFASYGVYTYSYIISEDLIHIGIYFSLRTRHLELDGKDTIGGDICSNRNRFSGLEFYR